LLLKCRFVCGTPQPEERMKLVWSLSLLAIVAGALVVTSCSSGPAPPPPGTPAFYWAAAKQSYAAGDYQKASEQLERVCGTENEYTVRARPWLLVLTSGMAKAYMELADYCDYGAKAQPKNPAPFRREAAQFRAYAKSLALQFAEAFGEFDSGNKDPKIRLDFAFPTGSVLMSPEVAEIGQGQMPLPDVLEDVRKQHVKTGVVQAACRAVGVAEDANKAKKIYQAGNVQVPRDVFLLAMAHAFEEQAQLFSRSTAGIERNDRNGRQDSEAAQTGALEVGG
jgi:hypothetical protein